uniref:Uncharacterized protein n=1 Tax=Strongyloides stercoralis TaxID=6248 RepID=A0AAF5DMI9_STRER
FDTMKRKVYTNTYYARSIKDILIETYAYLTKCLRQKLDEEIGITSRPLLIHICSVLMTFVKEQVKIGALLKNEKKLSAEKKEDFQSYNFSKKEILLENDDKKNESFIKYNLFLLLTINNVKLFGLLNSGAEVTVTTSNFAKRIGAKINKKKPLEFNCWYRKNSKKFVVNNLWSNIKTRIRKKIKNHIANKNKNKSLLKVENQETNNGKYENKLEEKFSKLFSEKLKNELIKTEINKLFQQGKLVLINSVDHISNFTLAKKKNDNMKPTVKTHVTILPDFIEIIRKILDTSKNCTQQYLTVFTYINSTFLENNTLEQILGFMYNMNLVSNVDDVLSFSKSQQDFKVELKQEDIPRYDCIRTSLHKTKMVKAVTVNEIKTLVILIEYFKDITSPQKLLVVSNYCCENKSSARLEELDVLSKLFRKCHDEMSHFGYKKSIDLIKMRLPDLNKLEHKQETTSANFPIEALSMNLIRNSEYKNKCNFLGITIYTAVRGYYNGSVNLCMHRMKQKLTDCYNKFFLNNISSSTYKSISKFMNSKFDYKENSLYMLFCCFLHCRGGRSKRVLIENINKQKNQGSLIFLKF